MKVEAQLQREKQKDKEFKDKISDLNNQLASKEEQIKELNKEFRPYKDIDNLNSDNFMKTLGIVKWKGEDPAWMKLQTIDRKNKQENK